MNLGGFLAQNHQVVRTGKLDEQSNYDSGERKSTSERCRKTTGKTLKSLQVFLAVPLSTSRFIVLKSQF